MKSQNTDLRNGQFSRRQFAGAGIGLGAFLLPQSTHRAQASPVDSPCKAVVVLLLEGGMSHFESWDPKPEAPAEIRGEFDAIATANPDLNVGEHFTRLARLANEYNVVRSVFAPNKRNDHSPGLHWVLTGYDNQAAGVSLVKANTHASMGAVAAHQRGDRSPAGLMNFVAVPDRKQLGGRVNFNHALHLGSANEAFDTGAIPDQATGKYAVPTGLVLPQSVELSRFKDRRALLDALNRTQRVVDTQATDSIGGFQAYACDLLLGSRGQTAFDLNLESAATRRRYGDHYFGQRILMARRLIEAGVTYVVVNLSKNNSWDAHKNNFVSHRQKLPQLDEAVSALLTDLIDRGLLDETLVLMTGEMGRTPRINGNAGRDHWSRAWSVMMAGGGLTRGQVLGSTTTDGSDPASRPVHLNEVLATVYHQLGIDPDMTVSDELGRPIRIQPESSPVEELLASS
jgi:uncharacterized protein (DUF1501 family)